VKCGFFEKIRCFCWFFVKNAAHRAFCISARFFVAAMQDKKIPRGFEFMFQGASQINLDIKGRLAVPVKHRERLSAPSEGKLVLTAHPYKCLLLYPAAAWEPIRDRVMKFPAMNTTASVWKRMLIGFAEELTLDNAGRILVSPELRAFAGIEREIMFVGQGSHFEVWSLTAWNQQLSALTSGQAGLPPGTEDFSL
jgi:MraZ protein